MFNFLFSKQKEKKIITKNELFESKLYTSEKIFEKCCFSFCIRIITKDNKNYLLAASDKNYDYLISASDFIDCLKENLSCGFIVRNEWDILIINFVFSNKFNQI